MPIGKRIEITIPPGVNKNDISYTALQYVDADKIRFYKGLPQKIGGWDALPAGADSYLLDGVVRSIYSFVDPVLGEISLIGTNTTLYAYALDTFYNITPVDSTTTGVTNLETYHKTLVSNPVHLHAGSPLITLTVTSNDASSFRIGDIITVSGISGPIGGIAAVDMNGTFQVDAITSTTIIYVNTSGTISNATTSGGGGSVVLASTLIKANIPSVTPYAVGEVIQIAAATTIGGIAIGDLNISAPIRYINIGSNYIVYNSTSPTAATSDVTGGGVAITIQAQIDFPGGVCDFQPAYGYGLGLYNNGNAIPTYGTGYQSVLGVIAVPQVWSFDRYGANIIMTPGNQQPVYTWTPNVSGIVPTILSGAPEFVNYVFVANNQVIVFGETDGGDNSQPNFISTSTNSEPTDWTSATSGIYERANVGRFIAHAILKNQVLLFSNNTVQVMVWSDAQQKWVINDLFLSDGLIGPKAVISFNNIVMWIGNLNWYIYNGSIVSVIPNNTLRQWFYEQLNETMGPKVFLAQNIVYDEIWVYFPTQNNVECDSYVIWGYDTDDYHFTNGTLSRTAAENPSDVNRPQYMANGSCYPTNDTRNPNFPAQGSYLYIQELTGVDEFHDNNNPMTGHLTTNAALLDGGNMIQSIERIIPSNVMLPLGSIAVAGTALYDLTVFTKEYDGQTIARAFPPLLPAGADPTEFPQQTVYNNTNKLEMRANGRQWSYQYRFSNTIGFRIQKMYAELKPLTQR